MTNREDEIVNLMTHRQQPSTVYKEAIEDGCTIVTTLPKPAFVSGSKSEKNESITPSSFSLFDTYLAFKNPHHTNTSNIEDILVSKPKSTSAFLLTPSKTNTHETNTLHCLLPSYDSIFTSTPVKSTTRTIYQQEKNDITKQIETRERHPDYPMVQPSHDLCQDVFEYKRQLKL
jgi:hypothetical protein